MTEHKLYILSCDAKFTLKNLITSPVKFIIKLGTWSNINHVADTYNYARRGNLVNQAVGTGYESIHYMKFFEHRNSTIRAYKLKVPIDFEKWHEDTKAQKGRKYDLEGAIGSAVDKIPLLREIFKKDPDDTEDFCSESIVEKLQTQGYVSHIDNKNNINPKELIKLLEKHDLCEPSIIVWKGNKMVKNIFEED